MTPSLPFEPVLSFRAAAPPGTTFTSAFSAVSNIVFAYSFVVTQFSFHAEMRVKEDCHKAVWAVGIAQIGIYTLTGAIIYVSLALESVRAEV